MILDPLKRAQKFFEVDPSFASKVMRLLVFAYCETPPGLRQIFKKLKKMVIPSLGSRAIRFFVFPFTKSVWDLGKIFASTRGGYQRLSYSSCGYQLGTNPKLPRPKAV